eukprot:3939828-Pyramimonas_sp.AAC.1
MEHSNTARYSSAAKISTPSMACSTHINHKHLEPRLLHYFSFGLLEQVVTGVGLELSDSGGG